MSFATHEAFYSQMAPRHDACIVENVPEYPVALVKEKLPKEWGLRACVVDPRLLGCPAARARVYMVAFNAKKLRILSALRQGIVTGNGV